MWVEIVNEIDLDQNGEIDFEEFANMMKQMLNLNSQNNSKNNESSDTKRYALWGQELF